MKVGVSGCLSFFNCRYDGKGFNDFSLQKAEAFLKKELNTDKIEFFPVCPEQLGGLSTPRVPSEIVGGDGNDVWAGTAKVMSKDGVDVTEKFKRGAQEVLNFAKRFDIKAFLLKEKSPSCGSHTIYSGKFDGSKIPGTGVTTALLEKNGIKVFTDTVISFAGKLKNAFNKTSS